MSASPDTKPAFRLLEARWTALGFEGLAKEEREALALFWLEGELMNGGLFQYFANSSGDLAPLALAALKRVGAERTHALLTAAMTKLSVAGSYPTDRTTRGQALEVLGWETDHFASETDELQTLPEKFFDNALERLGVTYSETEWMSLHSKSPGAKPSAPCSTQGTKRRHRDA